MVLRAAAAVLLIFAPTAQARDRAVFVYPREHSVRRIFYTSHQRKLRERVAERYDVDVHEQVATDDALFAINVDGAKLLVLSAHGDPFSMGFTGRRSRTLDSTDRERLQRFLGRLDPHATIVLQSCETGRGFAHLVKEAAGPDRHVIAARGEVPRDGLEVTSLSPFDVTIRCADGHTEWDCTLRLR